LWSTRFRRGLHGSRGSTCWWRRTCRATERQREECETPQNLDHAPHTRLYQGSHLVPMHAVAHRLRSEVGWSSKGGVVSVYRHARIRHAAAILSRTNDPILCIAAS